MTPRVTMSEILDPLVKGVKQTQHGTHSVTRIFKKHIFKSMAPSSHLKLSYRNI